MEQPAGFLEDIQSPLLQSTFAGAKVSAFRFTEMENAPTITSH